MHQTPPEPASPEAGGVPSSPSAGDRFGTTRTVDEIVDAIVDEARQAFRASAVTVFLVDPSTQRARVAASTEDDDLLGGESIVLPADVPGWDGFRRGCSIEITHRRVGDDYPFLRAWMGRLDRMALLVVPLLHGGVLLGALTIGFDEPRTFDPLARNVAEGFGLEAGRALAQLQV